MSTASSASSWPPAPRLADEHKLRGVIKDEMIALCCPLCFETFEKDPAKYLRSRALRKNSEDTHPPGSFSSFDQ